MRMRSDLPGRESGSALAISLLALAVLVTAGLSWEAFRSARSARATAEGVLRDYAGFAAVQFGREAQARLDNHIAAGLSAARHRALQHMGDLAIARSGTRDCDCAPPSATETMFAVSQSGVALVDGAPLDSSLVSALIAEIPSRTNTRHLARVLDDGRLLATSVARQGTSPLLIGFIARPSLLKGVFDRVIAEAALLPGTLVQAGNTRQLLTLRVLGATGREWYRTDDEWSALAGRGSFPPILPDLHVQAAVKPARAAELVIGGLPGNRWPIVVGLLVLAAGLVSAAAVQLRREVRFARQRADFISGVSHELRTPLAQIRLFGETLLLGRIRSADEAQRAAAVIVQESRRLGQMVDNVLLFSRAGRPRAAIQREPIDARALVTDIAGAFRPQASSRDMTVELDGGDDPVLVLADRDVIRQVLLNLLDNAVKYGARGQCIRVGLRTTPDGFAIAVSDEGPGVAAGDRARIWEPFWRASGSAEGGTGLGLAIVRDLVSLHGGTIAVDGVEPHGARFVATFAAPATPRSGAARVRPERVDQPV
jgi:signal transduction histidine kinase